MKLTVEDIEAINKGQERTFKLKDAKAVYSACVLVNYVKNTRLRSFETSKDTKKNTLTIRAL